MTDWIAIIGSIFSISGALYAFYQAQQSKKHSIEAQNIRNELIDRRKLSEISKIHNETHNILKSVSRIGFTSTESSVKSIKCIDIAKDVEEYSKLVNEQSLNSGNKLFNKEAKKLCELLDNKIKCLSEVDEFMEIRSIGMDIYKSINSFLPMVKVLTNEKMEKSLHFKNNMQVVKYEN